MEAGARVAPRALAAVALALLAGCGPRAAPERDAFVVDEVVVELLREPERLRPIAEGGTFEFYVAPRSPLPPARGAFRPCVAVPAEAALAIDVPDVGGPVELRLAVSISYDWHLNSGRHDSEWLRVRALVDGAEVARLRLPLGLASSKEDRDWRDVVLALDGPAEVRLEVDPPPSGRRPAVSFAGLTLNREREIERAPAATGAPNLLVVVVDTLRADRLGAYGYARPTSPVLDALAARGTLFEQAFAPAPWTWPSTASLLTGLEPLEHGVLDLRSCVLPAGLDTLGERLQRAGFSTAGLTTNPLVSADRRFDQGFEVFRSLRWERAAALEPDLEAFLDEAEGRRFLLYLQPTEPHLPYSPEPEHRAGLVTGAPPDGFDVEDFRRAAQDWASLDEAQREAARSWVPHASELYDGEIRAADAFLGRVLDELGRRGRLANTVVAVTSDHGEEFLEHGLLAHAHQVHAESVAVPLVLAGPGVPAGVRVAAPVSIHRLPGTLLRLVGVDSSGPLGAGDLLAHAGPAAPAPEPLRSGTDVGWWRGDTALRRLLAWREGDERLLLALPPEHRDRAAEVALYDLATDPGETRDLAAERPERVARLRAALEAWAADAESRAARGLGGGPDTEALLRAAGYLGD